MKVTSSAVTGVPLIGANEFSKSPCAGCACGKMSMSKFSRQSGSQIKTKGLLDLIHNNVISPITPISRGGARYIVTFIDDFSRFVHAFLIKARSEVLGRFMDYKHLVEAQTGKRIKFLRSDNGEEYTSTRFRR
jgi:hypothetical protein